MAKGIGIDGMSNGERAYAFSTIRREVKNLLSKKEFPTVNSGEEFADAMINGIADLKLGALCARYWVVSANIRHCGWQANLLEAMPNIYHRIIDQAKRLGLDGREIMVFLDSEEFEEIMIRIMPDSAVLIG